MHEMETSEILHLISLISLRTVWRISEVFGPRRAEVIASAIQNRVEEMGEIVAREDLLQLQELHPDEVDQLLAWAKLVTDEKAWEKRAKRLDRQESRVAMRTRYLPQAAWIWYETPDGTCRWRFDRMIRGMGLLQSIQEAKSEEPTLAPASPMMSSRMMKQEGEYEDLDYPNPEPEEGDDYGNQIGDDYGTRVKNGKPPPQQKCKLPLEVIRNLLELGVISGRSKWFWNTKTWGWAAMCSAFPNPVEACAYSGGLNSPTLPGGVLLNCPAEFMNIRTSDGRKIGSDGAGRIHPQHHLFDQMARPGGRAYTVQIRALSDEGVFCKGILVPDERCVDSEGNPTIWFDWSQVKGVKKQAAKRAAAEDQVIQKIIHVGVIHCWDRPGKIDWCFEILENIQDTEQNRATIKEYLTEAYEKMTRKGLEGLAAACAEDHPPAKLALQIIGALNQQTGQSISPMQIPWLADMVKGRLQRQLWLMAQGAGRSSPRYVAVMDVGVHPGTAVVARHPVGTELALFRIPLVLTQVLTTVKVAEPLSHHLVDGLVTPYTIYLNPVDMKDRIMGDDDGDIVGVSADPRDVRMFRDLISDPNTVLQIEPPDAKRRELKWGTEEAAEWMANSHKGPVGEMTMCRTRLLAIGDIRGARAMSVLIQEAVDAEKKEVVYTNYQEAVKDSNWKLGEDGQYRFDGKLNGTLDSLELGDVYGWVNGRLKRLGGLENPGTGPDQENVLAWRAYKVLGKKQINPDHWGLCEDRAGGFEGGNLVHQCNDMAYLMWREIADQFDLHIDRDDTISHLVETVLRKRFPEMSAPEDEGWQEYIRGTRRGAGVQQMAASQQKAYSLKDDAVRTSKLEEITATFQAEVREMWETDPETTAELMAQVWFMETTYERSQGKGFKGNLNYAYHMIAWPGSPVLEILGIEQQGRCDYLNPKKEQKVVAECLLHQNPFRHLTQILMQNQNHLTWSEQKGTAIHAADCKDCCERLQTALVRRIRADATRTEHEWARKMNVALNRTKYRWTDGGPMSLNQAGDYDDYESEE